MSLMIIALALSADGKRHKIPEVDPSRQINKVLTFVTAMPATEPAAALAGPASLQICTEEK